MLGKVALRTLRPGSSSPRGFGTTIQAEAKGAASSRSWAYDSSRGKTLWTFAVCSCSSTKTVASVPALTARRSTGTRAFRLVTSASSAITVPLSTNCPAVTGAETIRPANGARRVRLSSSSWASSALASAASSWAAATSCGTLPPEAALATACFSLTSAWAILRRAMASDRSSCASSCVSRTVDPGLASRLRTTPSAGATSSTRRTGSSTELT